MNRRIVLAAAVLLTAATPALSAPRIGQPAPAFSAVDADGRTRTLSEFKGKTVVMEWVNEGCPYVQKHYGSGNMQSVQRRATGDGVVWLTVNSSAAGMQGHVDGAGAKRFVSAQKAGPSAYLLDPRGEVGRAYDARTTPHMYVVNGAGTLVYMGGIDDKPTSDVADVKGAKNHVLAALADVQAGRAVATPVTKPYGCSVKYGRS